MPRSPVPNRVEPGRTILAALLALLVAALDAGPARAQFQLPPGLEEMMQRQGAGSPGAARGIDCTQLEAMARRGQQFPGGIDPQQLMQQMRCPSVQAEPREKPALAGPKSGESFCSMLRQMLENPDANYGAWLGPIPVHAATWMLSSCREQVAPAEAKAWGGLARFSEGRYAESADALREAAAQAPDELTRARYTTEMAKSLIAAGRNSEARAAIDRTLSTVDKLVAAAGPRQQPGMFTSPQQAIQLTLAENAAEERELSRRGLRGELLILRGLTDLNDNDPARAAESLRAASRLLAPEQAPGMPDLAMRGPAAALADVYLAMALARAGRGEEALPLLQKLIGGRDQFVGLTGQAQASVEMAQDMLSQLGVRLGREMPRIEMPSSGSQGMESGMLMSGEFFQIGPACALLQEIHFRASAPERALEAAEQCRARVLARSLADRSFQRQRVTVPTQQEARAYARKHRVNEGDAYEALLKERMSNPAADAASRPATVTDMRRAAAERNATIIVYSINTEPNRLPDRMPDREVGVTIWVVAPDGKITARRRGFDGIFGEGTLPLTAAVYRAREALDVPGRGTAPAAVVAKGRPISPRAAAALRQFHRLLIEPVEDLLPTQEGARLLIVPQGALFVVPFPALEDRAGRPIVARFSVSVTPSVQTLALTALRKQVPREPGAAVIVGNPVMPTYTPAPGRPPLDIGPLPGAEAEARAIAALLNTSPLTGAAATKSAVMGQARSARYVHLATHGILDDVTGEGQRSVNPHLREMTASQMAEREGGGQKTPGMLALAPEGGDNGMLMADEIAQTAVGADLVVMSACDSGRGAINDDGVIGLSRAWMAAGAPSVVVSLWSIPDEPTRDLMVEFYRRLAGGSGKAESLRGAMLATRATYPSPVNWAAFVLLGEPD
jgi:CHAT domain-containing protein/tetratricopeptide (TPR) repeat protein